MSVAASPAASQAPTSDPLPGVIERCSVNLLAGASGVGKTCLISWLLSRFRDSLPIFGVQPNPIPKIGFICADRGWHSTRQWFDRAGYQDICHYSLTDDLEFEPGRLEKKTQLIPVLRESLAKLDPLPVGSLVVVDPIALFMGGNLNDYQSCAVALVRIRRLCLERGITIIGLCHASKQKNDKKEQYKRLQDRIMGSGAQLGYGDTQMYLASPEELNVDFYTFLWHPHVSEARSFKLGRDKDTGLFIPYETADGSPLPAEAPALDGPVYARIPSVPMSIGFGELVEACEQLTPPVSRASIHRYLQELLQQNVIVKVEHGRYAKPALQ